MYVDDVKLFAKDEKELENLTQAVRIYSQDIGMELRKEKCAKLRKRQRTEVVELPNQQKNRTLGEKETYKYLGILEVDTIKHVEMRENFFKRVYQKKGKNYTKPSYITENSSKG